MGTCGQTPGGGLGRLGSVLRLLDVAGTTTTGNVGAGGGWWCCVFLPVKILTVLCKKSVFWPVAWGWELEDIGLDVEDIEWQRTTSGAEPADQSLPLEELEEDARTPAELERYGGGDSLSNTVRFGGGRMHF